MSDIDQELKEAEERFAPVVRELEALGWVAHEDIEIVHTGGNVYALAMVLRRDEDGCEPTLHVLLGDPIGADTAGGMIEDPRDGSQQVDLDSSVRADDAPAVAAWLTGRLAAHGHRPPMRRWSVQERTAKTPWRTESTYHTELEAIRAREAMARGEPTNDDGEPVEYRVVGP